MPPPNPARRDLLADAAIEVLAREGARGLTHRAVDAEAGAPPGTASRYFRTRDALVDAVVRRASALHFAELRPPDGPLDTAGLAAHLAGVVERAVTRYRSRHLAMSDLFLEATRRPGLRATLTRTRAEQAAWVRGLFRAAGVALDPPAESLLMATLGGLVFGTLTGPGTTEQLRELVAAAVAHATLPHDQGVPHVPITT